MRCTVCGKDHATYLHDDYTGTLPSAGSVPVLGRDRLPIGKRWNVSADRASASYVHSGAAWSRFLARARKESRCTRAECPCRTFGRS